MYCPGVQNTSADILYRYGQSIEGGNAVVAQNSLSHMQIAQLVQTWLSVVAPHVDYQHYCEAPKVGLERGNEFVSFPCPTSGAVSYDLIEHSMKLQAQHRYAVCKHKWSQYHLCRGILWLCWDANLKIPLCLCKSY